MTSIIKTIHGKAKFAYFNEPDDHFGNKKYHVVLETSKEEAEEHIKAIKKIISNEVVEAGKVNPNQTTEFKKANSCYTDLGETVEFKIHSNFKPKMYDRNGKPLGEDVNIWKDSTMWITYKASGYNKSMGIGCTLYIQSGQIDQLVTGADAGGSPYPDRDEEKPVAIDQSEEQRTELYPTPKKKEVA
tara:strand:- start:821 stop:1381 length:561 start_codon:yes stop_codon:yes gene_type:complete